MRVVRQASAFLLGVVLFVLATAVGSGETPPAKQPPATIPSGVAENISPEDRIRRALEKKIDVDYADTPLEEVADDLAKKLGVTILIDEKALSDLGIEITGPVRFKLMGTPAKSALYWMLRQQGLTTVISRDVLLITTSDEASNRLVAKVYDVRDLLVVEGNRAEPQVDFDSFISAITVCASPQTWDEVGGPGSIAPFETAGVVAVVVSQTEDVHDQIEDLLRQLRVVRDQHAALTSKTTAAKDSPQKNVADVMLRLPALSDAERAFRQSLAKPVSFDYRATPLKRVVNDLKQKTGLTITAYFIDTPRARIPMASGSQVSEEGVLDSEMPITSTATNLQLETALDMLTKANGLAWHYEKEMLVLSLNSDETVPALLTRTYDVSDLPGYRDRNGRGVPDYDGIMDMIQCTVAPTTWEAVGGPGSMSAVNSDRIQAVVVSSEWKTHRQIEEVLSGLRKLRGGRVTPADIARLPLAPSPEVMRERALRRRGGVEVPREVKPDPARDALVAGTNQFAFDLYRQLNKQQGSGQNLFFSPCSIATGLGMVYAGARGQTAEEMAKALHFGQPPAEIFNGFASLRGTLPAAGDRNGAFVLANRLWGQRGRTFTDPFQKLLQEKFGADAAEADFASPVNACDAINAWTAEKTGGRIKQIVSPGTLNSNTRFALSNAVYFKGQWAQTFSKGLTETAAFHAEHEKVDVAMMTAEGTCRYGVVDNVAIVEKPYRGGEMAMMILLPRDEPGSLAAMETLLSAENLAKWSKAMYPRRVLLSLPRFKLENSVALEEPLAALGMSGLFKPGVADLSGVGGEWQPLWLNAMLHRAQVNVDEEGTVAAAVSYGSGGFGGPDPRLAMLRCDRPFVFLIRDTRTGAILFLGRLARPAQERVEKTEQPRAHVGDGMF